MEERSEPLPLWLKIGLAVLAVVFLMLIADTYFAVYGTPGTYTVTPGSGSADGATPSTANATSSAFSSSTPPAPAPANASDSAAQAAPAAGTYASTYAAPPVSWQDSGATYDITGAAFDGSKLTFTLTIHTGSSAMCVPLNLRFVADETGRLQGPDTLGFAFPDSGNCNASANTDYPDQSVVFTVTGAHFPLLFTSNQATSTFFEVATTTSGGVNIELPATAG